MIHLHFKDGLTISTGKSMRKSDLQKSVLLKSLVEAYNAEKVEPPRSNSAPKKDTP